MHLYSLAKIQLKVNAVIYNARPQHMKVYMCQTLCCEFNNKIKIVYSTASVFHQLSLCRG